MIKPMGVAKQFNNDADKVVKALDDHVIDTGLLNAHATLPAPPRAGISCQDYIIKKLPGGKIVNVQGGGACHLSSALAPRLLLPEQ